MSTAVFPRVLGPVLVERASREIPSGLAGPAAKRDKAQPADLTIHRISKGHHGRTLLLLGHAAEHLANARRFTVAGREDRSDAEAIHLLMGLSREVFEDFAGRSRRRRMEEWVIQWITSKVEMHGRCAIPVSDNAHREDKCATC